MSSFFFRKLHGSITQLFSHFGSCGRCNRNWGICQGHDTKYSEYYGMFPLCEDCWQELTPEQRLPFYHATIERWESSGRPDKNGVPWEDVYTAVTVAVLGEGQQTENEPDVSSVFIIASKPLDEKQVEKLKERWDAQFGGGDVE